MSARLQLCESILHFRHANWTSFSKRKVVYLSNFQGHKNCSNSNSSTQIIGDIIQIVKVKKNKNWN